MIWHGECSYYLGHIIQSAPLIIRQKLYGIVLSKYFAALFSDGYCEGSRYFFCQGEEKFRQERNAYRGDLKCFADGQAADGKCIFFSKFRLGSHSYFQLIKISVRNVGYGKVPYYGNIILLHCIVYACGDISAYIHNVFHKSPPIKRYFYKLYHIYRTIST